MTDEEKTLLKQKWTFQKLNPIGNLGLGNLGLKILDFSKDDVILIEDWKDRKVEFNFLLNDRTIELSSPANPKNILRLRITELTVDKLVMVVSGRKGIETDDKFSPDLMELHYGTAN